MNKIKTFLIAITPLMIVSIIGLSIYFNTTNFFTIREITKKVKIFDTNIDHCHSLDILEDAKNQDIEIPKIAINFDTHSDLYYLRKLSKNGGSVEDWLNEYFAYYNEPEVLYWVIPELEIQNKEIMEIFKEFDDIPDNSILGNIRNNPEKVNTNIGVTPYIQYFKINTENGELDEIIPKDGEQVKLGLENPNSKYKIFKFINCTKSSLPDFKGKNVFLSIDMDYVSNSGFDTTEGFTINRTPEEINQEISNILNTLKKKNIRPTILTMTLSRYYLPKKDEPQVLKFFKSFMSISGLKDNRKEYTRTFDGPRIFEGPKYKGI